MSFRDKITYAARLDAKSPPSTRAYNIAGGVCLICSALAVVAAIILAAVFTECASFYLITILCPTILVWLVGFAMSAAQRLRGKYLSSSVCLIGDMVVAVAACVACLVFLL